MTVLPLPLRDRRVFFDSSAYLAIIDPGDQYHKQATKILDQLADQGYRHFTSNTIIIEAHVLILSNLGIQKASQFLKDMEESKTTVIRSRAADETRAKQILFQYDDKDFSFTDAISFAVMERLGVNQAFTFDAHFSQYGWKVLTPN